MQFRRHVIELVEQLLRLEEMNRSESQLGSDAPGTWTNEDEPMSESKQLPGELQQV